ncbi:hypothetical protein IIB97_01330 [Patescibacteria group bacterium]|nr:hypothetical protein [Patescibacteria group bacterium]
MEGAIEAAGNVGVSAEDAAKNAILGAIQAADEIGGEASSSVKSALKGAASLPREIVESVLGKDEDK